ncbi:MAG TPA: hypothetical protein VHH88_05820 [Verrucomicrobiae bacterium]|nr:hypothetical protein [Verrucomicrobiae bacterium]
MTTKRAFPYVIAFVAAVLYLSGAAEFGEKYPFFLVAIMIGLLTASFVAGARRAIAILCVAIAALLWLKDVRERKVFVTKMNRALRTAREFARTNNPSTPGGTNE